MIVVLYHWIQKCVRMCVCIYAIERCLQAIVKRKGNTERVIVFKTKVIHCFHLFISSQCFSFSKSKLMSELFPGKFVDIVSTLSLLNDSGILKISIVALPLSILNEKSIESHFAEGSLRTEDSSSKLFFE